MERHLQQTWHSCSLVVAANTVDCFKLFPVLTKEGRWDETAFGMKQGRSHGEQRVSQNTDRSIRLAVRLTIVSRQMLFHLTSLRLYFTQCLLFFQCKILDNELLEDFQKLPSPCCLSILELHDTVLAHLGRAVRFLQIERSQIAHLWFRMVCWNFLLQLGCYWRWTGRWSVDIAYHWDPLSQCPC